MTEYKVYKTFEGGFNVVHEVGAVLATYSDEAKAKRRIRDLKRKEMTSMTEYEWENQK